MLERTSYVSCLSTLMPAVQVAVVSIAPTRTINSIRSAIGATTLRVLPKTALRSRRRVSGRKRRGKKGALQMRKAENDSSSVAACVRFQRLHRYMWLLCASSAQRERESVAG